MVAYGDILRDFGSEFLKFLGNEQGERGQGNVFYTQMYYKNTTALFTIPEAAEYIHVYDLNPETLSFHTLEPAIPMTVGDAACLASSETPNPRLYIVGGYTNISGYHEIYPFFWIFDLEEYSWDRGNDMNYARYRHGCIVVDDLLWVMGTVPQIETINLTDAYNAEWSVHGNLSLVDNLRDFGVVTSQSASCPSMCASYCNCHSIYIIGGWIGEQDSGHNSDTVYIIDTISGYMTYDTLPFGLSALSTIMLKGTIYGFGGWNASSNWRDGHLLDISIKNEMLSGHEVHIMTLCHTLSFQHFVQIFHLSLS